MYPGRLGIPAGFEGRLYTVQACIFMYVWMWAVFSSFLADDHRWRWLEEGGGWPPLLFSVSVSSVQTIKLSETGSTASAHYHRLLSHRSDRYVVDWFPRLKVLKFIVVFSQFIVVFSQFIVLAFEMADKPDKSHNEENAKRSCWDIL